MMSLKPWDVSGLLQALEAVGNLLELVIFNVVKNGIPEIDRAYCSFSKPLPQETTPYGTRDAFRISGGHPDHDRIPVNQNSRSVHHARSSSQSKTHGDCLFWFPQQEDYLQLVQADDRVDITLDEYAKSHPDLSYQDREAIKADFEQIFAAPTLSAFSQRIRRMIDRYPDEPILLKRLQILKDKRFLFTNHLKFDDAPVGSSPLDRSMRFLDEKLL
jgi:hypothetical protein